MGPVYDPQIALIAPIIPKPDRSPKANRFLRSVRVILPVLYEKVYSHTYNHNIQ